MIKNINLTKAQSTVVERKTQTHKGRSEKMSSKMIFLIRVYAQSCLQGKRKLSAKEINRNFGRDTSFGVFEWSVENEVWERLSSVVTVWDISWSEHKLCCLKGILHAEYRISTVRRLQQCLRLPSERKTWFPKALLKGRRKYCELFQVWWNHSALNIKA